MAAATTLLSSCGPSPYHDNVAYAVSFALDDGTAFSGTITPMGRTRTISFTRPDGVSCRTTYPAGSKFGVVIPCTDGKWVSMSGRTTVACDYAELRLPDNRVARFTRNVTKAYVPAEFPSAPSGYYSKPSSAYCSNSNYYGAISCTTNRPRTNYVRGYYRKNGTYVKPYWRS